MSNIWIFYVLSVVPIIIGTILFIRNKEFDIKEWGISCGISLILAVIFHVTSIAGLTKDYETWSGQVYQVTHFPYWHAEWEEWVPPTRDSKGNVTSPGYWRHCEQDYPEHWVAYANYGKESDDKEIDKNTYNKIVKLFGGNIVKKEGHRPDFHSGDKYDYHTKNETKVIVPTTLTKRFENRIKASPSLFDFVEVPENISVYKYPQNKNWFTSDRLFGTAVNDVSILEWDKLNSRLGPMKKINLILIGFGIKDSSYADWQQAKWIGGKKNDIVLCYGGDDSKPTWSRVFGWSDSEFCKRNLESILLSGVNSDSMIQSIYEEVIKNYEIKEWDDFNYISVSAPSWCIWVYVIVMGVVHVLCWLYFHDFNIDFRRKMYDSKRKPRVFPRSIRYR